VSALVVAATARSSAARSRRGQAAAAAIATRRAVEGRGRWRDHSGALSICAEQFWGSAGRRGVVAQCSEVVGVVVVVAWSSRARHQWGEGRSV